MSERIFDVGPGFVRAKACPDCNHTRCGEGCACNCDAARAEYEAAWYRAEIERLKAELATAQHEVAQMDAALRVTVPEIEARMSSTCVWCGTSAPDPTSTEAMRAYVAEHVKVCANHPMRALEAELARLAPSGQVAEDVETLRFSAPAQVTIGPCWCFGPEIKAGYPHGQACKDRRAALSRLATKAHGYEAMKAERDAAIARAEEAEKQARLAWERHAEKDRAYGDMIAQRDAAVANNAAQREVFRHILERFESPFGGTADDRMRATVAACTQALARPHPGAALLKERQEREEVVKALAEALKTSREWVQNPTTRFLIEDALRRAQILR